MYDYKNMKIIEYINDLSTEYHVPAGGSVACINGSILFSLLEMVLSISKKKFVKNNDFINIEKIDLIIYKNKENKVNFLEFMRDDTVNFDELMSIYKNSKNLDIELKNEKISEKSILACEVPYKILDIINNDICEEFEYIISVTNKNLYSDLKLIKNLLILVIQNSIDNINANKMYINADLKKFDDIILKSSENLEKIISMNI